MRGSSPSIVPGTDQEVYLVVDDFGHHRTRLVRPTGGIAHPALSWAPGVLSQKMHAALRPTAPLLVPCGEGRRARNVRVMGAVYVNKSASPN
jgi:hypothetical protein